VVLVSLFFLFVYLFGAYAYGSATLLSLGHSRSLWGLDKHYAPDVQRQIDRSSITLFVISTIWFVLHTLIEFRELTGATGRSWIDLGTFIAFLFPPVIMRTLYLESNAQGSTPAPALYRVAPGVMAIISIVAMVYFTAAVFDRVPHPTPVGPFIGITIGLEFTVASFYSIAMMLHRPRRVMTADQARLRNVMLFLFAALITIFVTLMAIEGEQLPVAILDRASRAAPLYFMIASVYFENRFAFYDLVVKRALLLIISVGMIGGYLAMTLPWLDQLPIGPVRPWLAAVALAPVALLMRRVHERTERWLDRTWFGREFTTVEAVTHVLAAMQPATDEATLIAAAEARFTEIFDNPVVVRVGTDRSVTGEIEFDLNLTSPVSGEALRIVVLRVSGARRMLSEDLTLLRSLGGVVGFMLENIRLQRKRQEQEQVAQDLRLQSSKSELKALRAQINPHFLFNALNAIASLIHTDPARADEAVEQLAEVFRYTLRRSDSEWAPLDQELTFARAYLDVEQARFGQRLTFTIDSDHGAPAPLVPSMLLQTLLENAVKHGVSQERGPGRIDVIVRTTAEQVSLEVRNTGPLTRDPSTRSRAGIGGDARSGQGGEGFGLHSVRERLKGHFGDRASFTLARDESANMTVARITMPQTKVVS
jgi:Histidine kinase/Histidine kinase-, DNA gyrase B-, and HSP90-like ATPase